jgi:hypothetical protein
MTVVQLGLAGWIAGLLAYVGALAVLYRQGISGGDFRAVAFVSLASFGLCYRLVYLPVLRAVGRRLKRSRQVWALPLIAMLLGLIPTGLIARFYGGSLRAVVTPEALLFYILFAVVGLVVGFGFTRLDLE